MYENTIIKQYLKAPKIKDNLLEFYEMVFSILYNLIDTNMPLNMKLIFVSNLLSVNSLLFYKNKKDELVCGRLSRVVTYDSNCMPIDIIGQTSDGEITSLIPSNYVLSYNPLPLSYLNMKITEIAEVEKTIRCLRKYYKSPVIFSASDSKNLRAIEQFLSNVFSTDKPCTIVQKGFNVEEALKTIELKTNYITDKLMDENESLKEDILECLGIYKNTSSNRERVNETELIINNSLTTVNKLGLEDTLSNLINDVNKKFGTDYYIKLNIDKVFDGMKGSDNNEL